MSDTKQRTRTPRRSVPNPEDAKNPSVGARFTNDVVDRISTVAEKMSEKMKTTIHKSNVLEICVKSFLPELEKEYGIEVPEPTNHGGN